MCLIYYHGSDRQTKINMFLRQPTYAMLSLRQHTAYSGITSIKLLWENHLLRFLVVYPMISNVILYHLLWTTTPSPSFHSQPKNRPLTHQENHITLH